MNTSSEITELAKALSQAQAIMEHASKDKTNPHFKSKYADLASCLDACREPLAKNGLAVTQCPQFINGMWVLVTRLMHTSGQFIESQLPILNAKQDAQGFGSALTYARRYGLSAIIGLAQDDDDANHAVAKPAPKPSVPHGTSESAQYDGKKHADLSQFVMTAGKYAGKRLGQIEMKELKAWVEFVEVSAQRTGKTITGEQAFNLSKVKDWLGLSEKAAQESNGAT